jgi:hypothetical protein
MNYRHMVKDFALSPDFGYGFSWVIPLGVSSTDIGVPPPSRSQGNANVSNPMAGSLIPPSFDTLAPGCDWRYAPFYIEESELPTRVYVGLSLFLSACVYGETSDG